MEYIRKIIQAICGKITDLDRDAFKSELATSIVAYLKTNDLFEKHNHMVIGCGSKQFEGIIKESIPNILRLLMNQGGSMRSLAERLRKNEGGIDTHVGTPSENINVTVIPKERLQTEIWFYLESVKEEAARLIIAKDDWSVELDPRKRYTIGRSKESRDMSVMLTLPEANNYISRWQAEISCIEGDWYCKSVSEKCPTFVDDRFAEGDVKFLLRNIKNGGQIKFGAGHGFVITYCSAS